MREEEVGRYTEVLVEVVHQPSKLLLGRESQTKGLRNRSPFALLLENSAMFLLIQGTVKDTGG